MSWVAVGVGVASIAVSVSGSNRAKKNSDREAELQRRAGEARNAAAQLEANVLEAQAGQTIAASQRDMFDVQRASRLAQSRAIALSAASGGGASSPTVMNIVGNMAKEGAYNAARALYAGEEQARLMRIQAVEKRRLGEFDMTAGNLAGLAAEGRGRAAQLSSYGTVLNTAGSLYAKYGGRGPDSGGGGSGVDLNSGGAADTSVSSYA